MNESPTTIDRGHPTTDRISMVLIDDDARARAGVLTLLRGQPGFVVLAAATGAADALQLVRARQPHVVLMNMHRPEGDRLALAGALHGEVPDSRTVIMVLAAGEIDVSSLIRAGVSGFVMTNATVATVIETVSAVARGDDVLPPELTASLFAELGRRSPEPGPPTDGEQTPSRERDVRDLVVQGQSDQAIATRLHLTSPTVRRHVRRILGKSSTSRGLEVATLTHRAGPPPAAQPTSPPDEGPMRFLSVPGVLDQVTNPVPPA